VNISDYHPKVVSVSQGVFKLNVSLDNRLKISEGSLYTVFGSNTIYDKRFLFGTINNASAFNMNTTAITQPGLLKLELYYQNLKSFEYRSMILISNPVNILFTGLANVKLVSTKDIFNLSESTNVTVTIENPEVLHMTEEQFNSVQCKFGDDYVPTTRSGMNFTCELFSNITKYDQLTLYYRNADAYNGETLLSNSIIDILYVGLFNMSNLTPFATIDSQMNISITSTYKNLFPKTVYYECVTSTNKLTPATFIGNTFSCVVEKEGSEPYLTFISIIMKTIYKQSPITLSREPLPFYFMSIFLI
jgi:hypothetical protein